MAQKPVVVYIELPDWDEDSFRLGFKHFLEQDLGCEVWMYSHGSVFELDSERIRKYAKLNMLLLIIVAQAEYDCDDHERVVKTTRSKISDSIPINILPNPRAENIVDPITVGPGVYCHRRFGRELSDLVKSLTEKWPNPDWLGAYTQQDQAILMAQLENTYRVRHLNNDGMLGTPDANTQVVTEALRIRLQPSTFLREEFDSTLNSERASATPDNSAYMTDLEKIRRLSSAERSALKITIGLARGHLPYPGGGIQVTRGSCGPDINGFAIDTHTLEYVVTQGGGNHHLAQYYVQERIKVITDLRERAFGSNDSTKPEVITGLIFLAIEGFQTPLLLLFANEIHGFDEERIKKVGRFIQSERKYIPIFSHTVELVGS